MTLWILFNLFILLMLALDLGVFHRKAHEVTFKEACIWSAVWIALAGIFNLGIYYYRGEEVALSFLTAYFVEKSLSIDNVFVILTIMTFFQVPKFLQHKVLFWGILGALVMRAIFIFAGLALIAKFHWLIYVFGVFLILTAVKMLAPKKETDLEQNLFIRLYRKFFRVLPHYEGDKFFVKKSGHIYATPAFLALLLIEFTDMVFAVDSVPAILAITSDPFIVYSSNVFAILGMRSLYFAISGFVHWFHYLKYGLSAVLAFVGVKMLLIDFVKVPVGISLGVISSCILISVLASILIPKSKKAPHELA